MLLKGRSGIGLIIYTSSELGYIVQSVNTIIY